MVNQTVFVTVIQQYFFTIQISKDLNNYWTAQPTKTNILQTTSKINLKYFENRDKLTKFKIQTTNVV